MYDVTSRHETSPTELYTNMIQTSSDRVGRGVFLSALLPALLLACGDPEPKTRGGFDLRPQWTTGETYRIREEKEKRRGRGPFPPSAEVAERTSEIVRHVDVYREVVLEADGPRLRRTRRTYLTSVTEGPDGRKPTAMEGRTYEIAEPFGDEAFRLEAVDGEGGRAAAPKEQVRRVRECLLRVAASLLPDGPVRRGDVWRPGRNLSILATPGTSRMTPRLRSVEERDGRRVAVVECDWDVEVPTGPQQGTRISMRETLRVDLVERRLTEYQGVTEAHVPARPGRLEEWTRVGTSLSVIRER
jgi:hypothetical protein